MRTDARGIALVVVSTLQVGAAFAVTLFDEVGSAGAALLRLDIAALVLLAVWRPSRPSLVGQENHQRGLSDS